MIIDDTHRAAFVHVPKCGGTSVSLQFAQFDSYGGAFRGKGVHPAMGEIHYAHIPLAFLARHYPVEFDKVARYASFALVRDPHTRFASAVFQRLEEFGGARKLDFTSKLDITAKAVRAEAQAVIGWLAGRTEFCDLEYIHFCRQVDFVELDGRAVIGNVFALENIADMARALEASSGVRIDPERRENTNFASRSPVLAMLHVAKPVYSRLTSWSFRERVLLTLQRWKLNGPEALYAELREDPVISAFVEDYYARDIALYASAKARSNDDAPHRRATIASG